MNILTMFDFNWPNGFTDKNVKKLTDNNKRKAMTNLTWHFGSGDTKNYKSTSGFVLMCKKEPTLNWNSRVLK